MLRWLVRARQRFVLMFIERLGPEKANANTPRWDHILPKRTRWLHLPHNEFLVGGFGDAGALPALTLMVTSKP
jgi:hypothetical protein